MKVVIQCAADKRDGGFFKSASGHPVKFVAVPSIAPSGGDLSYAHPDDIADAGKTWRQHLVEYNGLGANPFGLFPAYQLYVNPVYGQLVRKFGLERVFILSAGWGLLRASFLTPNYDITYSTDAKRKTPWVFRRRSDEYRDLNQLPLNETEPIAFLGGKAYVPLFSVLTRDAQGTRTVFYNSSTEPEAPGCRLVRFPTTTRTNWQYEGARSLLAGTLVL
jgi:hypothetical protein